MKIGKLVFGPLKEGEILVTSSSSQGRAKPRPPTATIPKVRPQTPIESEYSKALKVIDDQRKQIESLTAACREALECIREWEDADLVINTGNIQAILESAITQATAKG